MNDTNIGSDQTSAPSVTPETPKSPKSSKLPKAVINAKSGAQLARACGFVGRDAEKRFRSRLRRTDFGKGLSEGKALTTAIRREMYNWSKKSRSSK